MTEICSVILAAGSSRRLGFNKLTLKIDSEAVIRRSVVPFIEAGFDNIIVVAGPHMSLIAQELDGLAVTVVHNEDHRSGMSSSIKAALPWISEAKAVFFHLGDKPFIEKKLLADMLEAYRTTKKDIVIPVCKGQKGHPVLMSVAPFIEEMRGLHGDKGLREVIEKHKEDVLFIETDEDALFDIDTADDIRSLTQRGYNIEKGKR
ncbi:MAG: putative MobA-like protein [Deltaproteobacteria bacterium]|nr:putative MobA-like protein [Deltaproteobacteria bacterium]